MKLTYEEFQNSIGILLRVKPASHLDVVFNPNYFVAKQKLSETAHTYNAMHSHLWNAVKPDKSYIDEKVKDPTLILWHRHLSWQTSVLWLNCCSDNLAQVVWFGLQLYGDQFLTKDIYTAALKKCKIPNVLAALESEKNAHIYSMLNSFYQNESTKKVRSWANHLKHRGTIDNDELSKDLFTRDQGVGFSVNANGVTILTINDLLPPVVTTSESLTHLVSATNAFISTFKGLTEIINKP